MIILWSWPKCWFRFFHTILHKNLNELSGQHQSYHSTCLQNLTKFISSFLKHFLWYLLPQFLFKLCWLSSTQIIKFWVPQVPSSGLFPLLIHSSGNLINPWLQRLSTYTNKKMCICSPETSYGLQVPLIPQYQYLHWDIQQARGAQTQTWTPALRHQRSHPCLCNSRLATPKDFLLSESLTSSCSGQKTLLPSLTPLFLPWPNPSHLVGSTIQLDGPISLSIKTESFTTGVPQPPGSNAQWSEVELV